MEDRIFDIYAKSVLGLHSNGFLRLNMERFIEQKSFKALEGLEQRIIMYKDEYKISNKDEFIAKAIKVANLLVDTYNIGYGDMFEVITEGAVLDIIAYIELNKIKGDVA